MKLLIDRIKNIENDNALFKQSNDFQSLYLRSTVNRDKAQWAIVGYKLELLIKCIFHGGKKILRFRDIEELTEKLKFEDVHGPERGDLIKAVRATLESEFKGIQGLSSDLFRKRLDRVIWELAASASFEDIKNSVASVL